MTRRKTHGNLDLVGDLPHPYRREQIATLDREHHDSRTNHWLCCIGTAITRDNPVLNGIQGRQIGWIHARPRCPNGIDEVKGGQVNGRILGWI
jgi:hypothetical protein